MRSETRHSDDSNKGYSEIQKSHCLEKLILSEFCFKEHIKFNGTGQQNYSGKLQELWKIRFEANIKSSKKRNTPDPFSKV